MNMALFGGVLIETTLPLLADGVGRKRPIKISMTFYQNNPQWAIADPKIRITSAEILLVSWCFKPSQPQRITSGLKETFIKRKS